MQEFPDHSYTGVKGNIAVYNPDVKLGDSYAEIHILNGVDENVNSIMTGWMVF